MEQCPMCKEKTLVYGGDEFGEYCVCINQDCDFGEER